jgi:hypothetical protein
LRWGSASSDWSTLTRPPDEVPARTFGKEWITSDIGSFKSIKLKWKAAISAMIMRAGDLGIVTDQQRESLMMTLGRKGWRRREPFDDDFDSERPRFFARACELIVSELVLSKAGVLGELDLERSDVETILGLTDFFKESPQSEGEAGEPQLFLKFPA